MHHASCHDVSSGRCNKKAALKLLDAIDVASDNFSTELCDWQVLQETLYVPQWAHSACSALDCVPLPCVGDISHRLHDHFVASHEETSFYVCTAFVEAHAHARDKVRSYFVDDVTGEQGPEELQVQCGT